MQRQLKTSLLFASILWIGATVASGQTKEAALKFEIAFPESISKSQLTGRMFLAISETDSIAPRHAIFRC